MLTRPEHVRQIRAGQVAYVAVSVLAGLAPVAALALAWSAFGQVFTLAGGTPPTDAQRELAYRLILGAGVVAVGPPLVGLVLAVRRHSRGGAWVFGLLFAGGVVFAGLVLVVLGPSTHLPEQLQPRPEPSSTRSTCQEYSGGGTRCPGG